MKKKSILRTLVERVVRESRNRRRSIKEAESKNGDGFSAVNKGTIKGYEDETQYGTYDDIEITLSNKLNLGNNYTMEHFVDALKQAYPEDSDLMSYLGDTGSGDDITFKYVGKFGKHEDNYAASDLHDYLR